MEHEFKDVQFMSALEKRQVLNAWKRFLKNGLPFSCFSTALYHHLINHCSFIAHYNRLGFYEHYFSSHPTEAVRFLSQFDRDAGNISAEYGWTHWLNETDYRDINQAMVDLFDSYKAALYKQFNALAYHMDIANATALLSRHKRRAVFERDDELCPETQTIPAPGFVNIGSNGTTNPVDQLVLFQETED